MKLLPGFQYSGLVDSIVVIDVVVGGIGMEMVRVIYALMAHPAKHFLGPIAASIHSPRDNDPQDGIHMGVKGIIFKFTGFK